MTTTEKPAGPSNIALIREYFFAGDTKTATKEIKELTPEDRTQLGEAIRNGTMTY